MFSATQSPNAGYLVIDAGTDRQMPAFLRLLDWLAEADYRYRQSRKLQALTDARLDDMGLTRKDAASAF